MSIKHWINGKQVDSADRFITYDPATGEVIDEVAAGGQPEIDAAVAAAAEAFPKWAGTPAKERARLMRRLGELIDRNVPHLAELETRDTGLPISQTRKQLIPRASENFTFFAEVCTRMNGHTYPVDDQMLNYTLYQPVGVCALVSPWNVPFMTATWKTAPCLALGNTAVLKMSELSPLTADQLGLLALEAGIPPGVLNVVQGYGATAGDALVHHPGVRAISFTGGTVTGKKILSSAGGIKKFSMELGGKSPVLVFDDADIDRAATMLAKFKVRNAGQVCVSPTRFYVQNGAYEQFLARFTDVLKNIKVGDGLEAGTDMGPLAHERRVPAMSAFIDDAKKHGGKVVVGGGPLDRKGFFFAPTVVTDLPDNSMLMTEEPFGPVAPVVRFTDTDEVLARANSLPFGLSSYVFTNSLQTATKVSNGLEAGMVNINHFGSALAETPFGGIKDSGIGSEGGLETFDGYLVTKFITHI